MAEAIAMVGLASSIAIFIDMGLGIVKTGRAIFNSARDTTDEAYELGLILEDVNARLNEVLVFMRSGRHSKQQRGHDKALQKAREERERYEKNLQSIAAECKRLSKGLQDILSSLAVKKNARFSRLEAGKVTMKSFLKKDDIETLRGRLERLETRLRIHVSETVEEIRYIQLLEELHTLKACRMTLGLMKALPAAPRSPTRGLNKSYTVLEMSGLVDNLLYYAHEFEKSSEANHDVVTRILDRADWVISNYVSLQENDSLDVLRLPVGVKRRGLGGKCNFLALAVEAQLVNYVSLKLEISPESITKAGRPLLDWAISPRRITPASFLGHGDGGPEGVDARMVALLLEKGASPFDRQSPSHPTTVWDTFLQASYGAATETEPGFDGIRGSWLQVTRLLIEHGAGDEPAFRGRDGMPSRPSTLRETLDAIFGPDETQRLLARIATIHERQSSDHWAWLAWKQLHQYLPVAWAYP